MKRRTLLGALLAGVVAWFSRLFRRGLALAAPAPAPAVSWQERLGVFPPDAVEFFEGFTDHAAYVARAWIGQCRTQGLNVDGYRPEVAVLFKGEELGFTLFENGRVVTWHGEGTNFPHVGVPIVEPNALHVVVGLRANARPSAPLVSVVEHVEPDSEPLALADMTAVARNAEGRARTMSLFDDVVTGFLMDDYARRRDAAFDAYVEEREACLARSLREGLYRHDLPMLSYEHRVAHRG